MRKIILLLVFINIAIAANAQNANKAVEDKIDYTISNNEKVITNEMIFSPPQFFENIKPPLFLVNGNKVECISYYNKNEIKSIQVLQPKDAVAKYKTKGRNGVVLVTLKPNATYTEIRVTTNKTHYKCINENNITDTSKSYYDKVNGKNCTTLDLVDTGNIQTLYTNFDNIISIKNLGVGWDRTILTMSGGSMSGSGFNDRIIRVTKKGTARLVIGKGQSDGTKKITLFEFRVLELPEWK